MASSLASSHTLGVDEPLVSDDGTYRFVLQTDGNLVLYKRIYDGRMRPLWASNTVGSGAITCSMQADGNLVLYDSAHHPKWASNTAGSTGSSLIIQDDGNAVICRPNRSPVWTTNTVDAPPLGAREHNKIEPAVREAIIAGFKGQEGDESRQYLKYEGHEFWIHPLTTTRTSYGNKKVTGRISHILGGRVDDQIDVTLTYVAGDWQPPDVDIDLGGFAPILKVVLPISALVTGIITGNPLGLLAGAVARAKLAEILENKFTGDGWRPFCEMIVTEIVIQSTPTLRFLWSSDGPFRTDLPFGYRAVKIDEPAEPAEHGWGDNHLLIENVADVDWAWSYAGPRQGDERVSFNNPSDPRTWVDNYLCFSPKFGWEVRFSCAGPLDGYSSERILETADPHAWGDSFLCWRKVSACFLDNVQAAVRWPNGKAYFFRGSEYIRYDIASDKIDSGYPKSIWSGWPGWPARWDNVDCGVVWNNGKAYFFRGSEYIRYDIASEKVDSGYPRSIASGWPGWPEDWDGVDAGVVWNSGKAYFFRGSEYIRYDMASDRVDDGYPGRITRNWAGWPADWSDIGGGIVWDSRKAYFFKGTEYIRYDIASDRVDDGYPGRISSTWHAQVNVP